MRVMTTRARALAALGLLCLYLLASAAPADADAAWGELLSADEGDLLGKLNSGSDAAEMSFTASFLS